MCFPQSLMNWVHLQGPARWKEKTVYAGFPPDLTHMSYIMAHALVHMSYTRIHKHTHKWINVKKIEVVWFILRGSKFISMSIFQSERSHLCLHHCLITPKTPYIECVLKLQISMVQRLLGPQTVSSNLSLAFTPVDQFVLLELSSISHTQNWNSVWNKLLFLW